MHWCHMLWHLSCLKFQKSLQTSYSQKHLTSYSVDTSKCRRACLLSPSVCLSLLGPFFLLLLNTRVHTFTLTDFHCTWSKNFLSQTGSERSFFTLHISYIKHCRNINKDYMALMFLLLQPIVEYSECYFEAYTLICVSACFY